jgi:glycosyltransferase involved in cell wall biosynthesis
MKVLHVINTLQPAGAEILLSVIAPALKSEGFDVEIATLFRYPTRSLYEALVRADITIHSFDFSFRYSPRIRRALKTLIDSGGYDIVHAHLFPALYWTALCRPRVGKLIVSEHSSYNTRRSSVLFRAAERFVYKKYDKVFCISNGVKTALARWLPECAGKMVTVYNGIELEKFRAARPVSRADLGVPAQAPVACMVSRIDLKIKDHKTVIESAAALDDLHVLFVGGGEGMQDLRSFARERNVADRVHFLGYRSDIPSVLKASDVYVHSSNWEGFGLAVVEAMAGGVPVVASDVEGLNEVVQNGTSGLLFKKGDPADLARNIGLVLSDVALRDRLKAGGDARARDFSVETTVSRFIEEYGS